MNFWANAGVVMRSIVAGRTLLVVILYMYKNEYYRNPIGVCAKVIKNEEIET